MNKKSQRQRSAGLQARFVGDRLKRAVPEAGAPVHRVDGRFEVENDKDGQMPFVTRHSSFITTTRQADREFRSPALLARNRHPSVVCFHHCLNQA